MIIKIVAVPDMPILDKVEVNLKKDFVGLVMQARSGEIAPSNYKEGYLASKSLHPGAPFHFVYAINVLGAANEAKKYKLYSRLLTMLLNKGKGLIFSYDDVEVLHSD